MNKSYKIAGLVAILLGVMVATQYVTGTTPEDLNNKPGSEASKKAAAAPTGSVKIPESIGPKTAPVKIRVYVTSDNHCDTTTINGMKAIAKKFGKDVRIDYVDLLDKHNMAEAQKAKISCKSGLTINGKSVLHIPGHGVRGLVMFDGPMGLGKNYDVKEVEPGVAYLLQQHQGKPQPKADPTPGLVT